MLQQFVMIRIVIWITKRNIAALLLYPSIRVSPGADPVIRIAGRVSIRMERLEEHVLRSDTHDTLSDLSDTTNKPRFKLHEMPRWRLGGFCRNRPLCERRKAAMYNVQGFAR